MQRAPFLAVMGLIVIPVVTLVHAQSPDTPIFEQGKRSRQIDSKAVVEAMLRLKQEGKLISKSEIEKQLLAPQPQAIALIPAHTRELSTEEVAAAARAANLKVGYCYLCERCDEWHTQLAGGYAIAEDVIVTCDHLLNAKTKMREGYLMAMDQDGNVAGTVAVMARSADMDLAILRVSGAKFKPVPLNSNIRQGSASYCFSKPMGLNGYFSAGIVNRFFFDESYQGEDEGSLDALRHLRVNFSNDWAPGSSGSPLLDQAGNVIGHVSTISGVSSGKDKNIYITLHTGTPARSVERMVAAMEKPDEIVRIAALKAQKKGAPDKADEASSDTNAGSPGK